MTKLTQKYLKSVLNYNPDTGIFIWLKTRHHHRVGCVAGGLAPKGYIRINLLHKLHLAHRLAFLYITGDWPNGDVDHINRNPSDNKWCNLRECSTSANCSNVEKPKNNTSGYKGVHWHSINKKWYAAICINRRQIHLGTFPTKEDAALAYNRKSKELFGEFSNPNVII